MGRNNVKHLGGRRYHGEIECNGKKKRKVHYADSESEALRLHRKFCSDFEMAAYPGGSKPPPGTHIMQELADWDIKESQGVKKKGSDEWRIPPRNPKYQKMLKLYWERILASPEFPPQLDIRDIDGKRIKAFGDRRMMTPGIGWVSISREVGRITRMLRKAECKGWVPYTPSAVFDYSMDDGNKKNASKGHAKEAIRHMMSLVTEKSRDWHEFLALTGLRNGEMARLTMNNITPTVGIPGIVAVIRLTEAKTNSRMRAIGIDQRRYDIARKYASADPGKPIWGVRYYECQFRRNSKRIYGKTITPRDLRSWFITETLEKRGLTATMQLAGHRKSSTTSRYQKNPEHKNAAACTAVHESWDEMWSTDTTDSTRAEYSSDISTLR